MMCHKHFAYEEGLLQLKGRGVKVVVREIGVEGGDAEGHHLPPPDLPEGSIHQWSDHQAETSTRTRPKVTEFMWLH